MTKIILILMLAGAISCNENAYQGRTASADSKAVTAPASAVENQKPESAVALFMNSIASEDLEKAKSLLTPAEVKLSSDPVPPNTKASEKPGRLDWVAVLRERNFRMGEVLEEKTENDKSDVKVAMRREDLKDYRQNAVFHLSKIDGRWLIADIELLGDDYKPAPGNPKA